MSLPILCFIFNLFYTYWISSPLFIYLFQSFCRWFNHFSGYFKITYSFWVDPFLFLFLLVSFANGIKYGLRITPQHFPSFTSYSKVHLPILSHPRASLSFSSKFKHSWFKRKKITSQISYRNGAKHATKKLVILLRLRNIFPSIHLLLLFKNFPRLSYYYTYMDQ